MALFGVRCSVVSTVTLGLQTLEKRGLIRAGTRAPVTPCFRWHDSPEPGRASWWPWAVLGGMGPVTVLRDRRGQSKDRRAS